LAHRKIATRSCSDGNPSFSRRSGRRGSGRRRLTQPAVYSSTAEVISNVWRSVAPAAFLDQARRRGWDVATTLDARIPSGGIHHVRGVRPS
jgi:hypothetical protein